MEQPPEAYEWPDRFVPSINKAAAFFGVTPSTYQRWLDLGLPAKTDRGWDLLWALRWRFRRLVEEQRGQGQGRGGLTDIDGDKSHGELTKDKLLIHNTKAMLELRKLNDELIEVSAVEAEVRSMITAVRQRLQALPGELAAGIPPELRAEFVSDAGHVVENVCRQMAAWAEDEA